jgi:hypothetical protein
LGESPQVLGADRVFGSKGEPFTRQTYEARKKAPRDLTRFEVDKSLAEFNFALEVMLDAANHSRCYGPFVSALTRRLIELTQEFGLLDAADRILSDYGAVNQTEIQYRLKGGYSSRKTFLFALDPLEQLLSNRDQMRPWLYGEIPKENKPSVPPAGSAIDAWIPIHLPWSKAAKQASEQSSRQGKSPRKRAPAPLPRGRDSAARKPSGSRRDQAPG